MSAVRHTAATVARACELRVDGWTVHQIRNVLERELGVRPSHDTVCRWTNPAYAEKRNANITRRNRKVLAEQWTFSLPRTTPEYRRAFVHRLHGEGVPGPSIARVCRVLFNPRITAYDVTAVLAGEVPRRFA